MLHSIAHETRNCETRKVNKTINMLNKITFLC